MTAHTSILDLEPITQTDDGNALRLILAYGPKFRRVADMHRWLNWNGVRWAIDHDERQIREAAREVPAHSRKTGRTRTSNATRCQQPASQVPSASPCPIRASASLQRTWIHIQS